MSLIEDVAMSMTLNDKRKSISQASIRSMLSIRLWFAPLSCESANSKPLFLYLYTPHRFSRIHGTEASLWRQRYLALISHVRLRLQSSRFNRSNTSSLPANLFSWN